MNQNKKFYVCSIEDSIAGPKMGKIRKISKFIQLLHGWNFLLPTQNLRPLI